MSEQELELPKGWVQCKIDDISDVLGGKRLPKGHSLTKEKTSFPYIRVTNFQNNTINEENLQFINKKTHEEIKKYIISSNDIYISIAGSIGLVGLVPFTLDGANLTENAAKICNIEIEKNFLNYELNSPLCQSQISKLITSTNQGKLALFRIRGIILSIPPLNEQKRIVSKIEELFSKIDSTKQSLEQTKLQQEQYRQSLLKSAFEERHSEWKNVTLGKITDLTSGKAFKKSEYSETGVRLFQIANVTFGKTLWEDIVFMPNEYLDKYPHLKLKEGDLLMALNRPFKGHKLKITLLKKEDTPSILYQRVGRFDLNNDVNHHFFYYYLQSPLFIIPFQNLLKGVDQPFVNKTELLKLDFAYPSLEEQEQIVSQIEQGFSLIENTQNIVNSTLQTLQTMKMSVLKNAFEGKLVPQDPNDEPAHLLLEKIKSTKEAQPTKKRRAKNVK